MNKKKHEQTILKYQQQLEAKNVELQQRNVELSSFSYIASHDLQEPLRKIRTFSSRIMDKDYEQFSENTKDNIQRIILATQRMENLITSLLTYSSANPADLIVKTDLNKLLEEAKDNLAELIMQNNATIITTPLPHLEIIPHQFQQLFSNMLVNAIKYKRKAGYKAGYYHHSRMCASRRHCTRHPITQQKILGDKNSGQWHRVRSKICRKNF